MQDIHDERRIPLEPEPQRRSVLESIRHWLSVGRSRRVKREARQQSAADLNAVWHEADADRHARQPGNADTIAQAERVMGRVGGGR